MKPLTKGQSRVGALLVLGVAASLLILLIVYPLARQYRAMGTAIEDTKFQIIRYQSLAENHEMLKAHLNQMKGQSRAASHYVKGESAALASANMQQHLKGLLNRIGGELISTQRVGRRGGDDNESATSLQVHMKADISTLLQVLYRLENAQPMFFVDELSINARPLRNTARSKSAPIVLDVRFNLTGYRQEAE